MSDELNLDELAGGAGDDPGTQDAADPNELSAEQGQGGEKDGADDAADKQQQQQSDTGGDKDKTVPLAALLEERKKFQGELDSLKQQNQRFAGLEQQLREMREGQKKVADPAPKEETPPDYLTDPKGYVDWQRNQAEKRVNEVLQPLQQSHQQTEQQRQVEAQINDIVTKASTYEVEFTKANPRYMDALGHIRQLRMAEAEALGIPQAHAMQALRNQELQLAAFALQNGKNPAELAYNLALRLGFNPESNAGAQGQQKAAEQSEQEKLEMAAKRERAQSMGGQGGGGDAKDLLEADNEEFEAAMQQIFGKGR